jgi:hypothetical protein
MPGRLQELIGQGGSPPPPLLTIIGYYMYLFKKFIKLFKNYFIVYFLADQRRIWALTVISIYEKLG